MKPKHFLLIVLLVILPACGGATTTEPPAPTAAPAVTTNNEQTTAEKATEAPAPTPVVEEPVTTEPATAADESPAAESDTQKIATEDFITTASGLQYAIIQEGAGEAPQTGDLVQVHYTGTLEDGTKFDSSYDRGDPIAFPLGVGQVIPGWDEGIALLTGGSKARLIIPSELGYGERGAGGVIPPIATLIFDVELVGIQPGPPDAPTAVNEADYITTESGLKYYDLEEGSGNSPRTGRPVIVHYTGWLEDGTMFDSS